MSSDEKAAEAQTAKASSGPKLPLILGLINMVAALGAVGMLTYTRLLFKRPVITEESERARLTALNAKPVAPAVPGLVTFEPMTVNIASTPSHVTESPDSAQRLRNARLHYATLGFALELRDQDQKDSIDELRPLIMDKLISVMGRKTYQDIATVQGRYLLRTQIAEFVNHLVEGAERRAHAGDTTEAQKSHAPASNQDESHGHGRDGTSAESPESAEAPGSGDEAPVRESAVTGVYFTQFIVQ